MQNKSDLTLKKIFVFWLPLAASWLMMSVEGPFIAAVIARLENATYNLAAYWVAYAFALIVEAPVIMMLSASTALVKDKQSFQKLRRFTQILNFSITGILLILLIPVIYDFLTLTVMGLENEIAGRTYIALWILLPWPGMIGYRRFYQGVLIRYNLTKRVTYGTIIRLLAMASTALTLFYLKIEGAYVGAAALAAGVTFEAYASRVMAHGTVKKLMAETPSETPLRIPLTHPSIIQFYYPLALTSLIGLAVHPLVTFFLGQSRFAIESLAVMSVIHSLVFIFRSMGLAYQEVAITFLGEGSEGYPKLKQFATYLGMFVVTGLSAIAFTPLGDFWFITVSGLSQYLADFSRMPIKILALLPALTVLLSFQRAILVNGKKTAPISTATAIEVSIIIFTLYLSIKGFDFVGAIAAASALITGRLCANGYLVKHVHGVINK
jgi:hypothetical protein